ncbi:whi2p [Saccharomyces arboricola H-6]|uniref:Whi2p n=1 Tax=Saccharomyces arboricola (strain H-6 / AS 2.3317 / CBS 10644) TaxID=1160507 RepID=J8LI75_SACAR|nr:whi2p [Saccharomyces arboricola H-6]
MDDIITQVSPDNADSAPILQQQQQQQTSQYEGNEEDYGDSLIHLNIQENHYFITRDQLMSLSESLLLCLFPSGVFLDRCGQVITNLTRDDEVYIVNFPPDCFEYIMEIYTRAHDDLYNHPVEKLYDRPSSSFVSNAKGFFGLNNNSSISGNNEQDILHQKPAIIVLREDLDYYCVPQEEFQFHSTNEENNEDLLRHFMAQVKMAAGSYLTSKTSIFQGLYSSNRLKQQQQIEKDGNCSSKAKSALKKLGPAEQHLMDMLCSSGFTKETCWGNRTQETGKTVISSLSLCRLANETTEEFRQKFNTAKAKWEADHKPSQDNIITPMQSNVSVNSLSVSKSNSTLSTTKKFAGGSTVPSSTRDKRKSRLSKLADNVRSHSSSRHSSQTRNKLQELPKLYDLVPKPNINAKLLLFWRKPARKCWWGEEDIELEVEVFGSWKDESKRIIELILPTNVDPEAELHKITVPVRLHIRRVWTLELSVIGVQ